VGLGILEYHSGRFFCSMLYFNVTLYYTLYLSSPSLRHFTASLYTLHPVLSLCVPWIRVRSLDVMINLTKILCDTFNSIEYIPSSS
jgi:hypothetical protein